MAIQGSPLRVRTTTAALVVGVLCFFTDLLDAGADAKLEAVDQRAKLREASHILDIEIDGDLARFTSRQTLVNTSDQTSEAIYTFELPGDAAVTGLAVRLADGRTTRTAVVDARAALHFPSEPGQSLSRPASADIGLVRLVERNGVLPTQSLATYETRLYPLQPRKAITVRTTWVMPVNRIDGRMVVRIPGRGGATNLVAEKVRVSVNPPPDARAIRAIYGGGAKLTRAGTGNRRNYAFVAPARGDLVVEAVPTYRQHTGPDRTRVQASYLAIPITKSFGVLAVNATALPVRGEGSLDFERAILVFDVSRSMEESGIEAAGKLARALLGSMPPGTKVQAVLYDRKARQVLESFQHNDHRTQRAILEALAPTARNNGSDLGQALLETQRLIDADELGATPAEGVARGARATNLIAVFSDGMTPLALTPDRAADALGEEVLRNSEILTVALVPEGAPVPDTEEGALAGLTRSARGRSIAVRHAEAETRGDNLAAELRRPAPIHGLELDAGQTNLQQNELANQLEPGHSASLLTWYYGAAPKKLLLTGTARGTRIEIPARRGPASQADAFLALAVARAAPADFVEPTMDPDDPEMGGFEYDESSLADAHRRFLQAATRASAVSGHSSLVALDGKDALAKDRLALMRRWGPSMFFRYPPPPERASFHEFRPFEENRDVPGGAGSADDARYRRTGNLDRTIVKRLIETYVVPQAKACYDRQLRNNNRLRGALVLEVEIARGEVQHAEISSSSFVGASIETCVVDAAFAMRIPRVALGTDPETVGVARYPLRFRMKKTKGAVEMGEGVEEKRIDVDLDKPLGGLPE